MTDAAGTPGSAEVTDSAIAATVARDLEALVRSVPGVIAVFPSTPLPAMIVTTVLAAAIPISAPPLVSVSVEAPSARGGATLAPAVVSPHAVGDSGAVADHDPGSVASASSVVSAVPVPVASVSVVPVVSSVTVVIGVNSETPARETADHARQSIERYLVERGSPDARVTVRIGLVG